MFCVLWFLLFPFFFSLSFVFFPPCLLAGYHRHNIYLYNSLAARAIGLRNEPARIRSAAWLTKDPVQCPAPAEPTGHRGRVPSFEPRNRVGSAGPTGGGWVRRGCRSPACRLPANLTNLIGAATCHTPHDGWRCIRITSLHPVIFANNHAHAANTRPCLAITAGRTLSCRPQPGPLLLGDRHFPPPTPEQDANGASTRRGIIRVEGLLELSLKVPPSQP